ncbi:MAG: UvrB/UvrC motif-containing protein [Pirellulales bacterium]|nr:UvrB/UvrC motif-containing protein [Pirellulales bacterium]
MSSDLDPILNDWSYRPDEITVRVIEGNDGRRKIQLRLDLGVLQMEFDGRPDGRRIHDQASWFDFHRRRQAEHEAANPDGAPYRLEPEDCAELLREGVQFYHRYICFWHLGHYELCARDTERNLRLFAFVREHARDDRDKLRFDQWRPYVTMMHARAVATPLVELEQWDAAANVVDAGIRGIEQFLEDYNQVAQASQVGELSFLRQWKEEILQKIQENVPGDTPASLETSPTAIAVAERGMELREQIDAAIREERYEDAAQLRDELRHLEG